MSSIEIHQSVLQKLTHETVEIRLRALEQIYTKLLRAQTHKETISYKPDELCKQLIRWFGVRPVQAPLKVLEILNLVMQNTMNALQILQRIGAERFKKELGKVKCVLEDHACQVELYKKIEDLIELIDTCVQKSGENDQLKKETTHVKKSIINCNGTCSKDGITHLEDLPSDYFEAPSSRPLDADFTSMKFIADILINPSATELELQNALLHLQITIYDYPAEHLLQDPHIFRNLLHRFEDKCNDAKPLIMSHVAVILAEFLNILQKELKMKRKTLAVSVPSCLLKSPVRLLTDKSSSSSTSSAISSDSTESVDQNISKQVCSQLRVDKALSLLLNCCLVHFEWHIHHGQVSPYIWDILYKVINLCRINNWRLESKHIIHVGKIVTKLYTKINNESNENCCRLRIFQIHLLLLLVDLIQFCKIDELLQHMKTFHCIITDIVFTTLFPKQFQKVCDYLYKEDKLLMESLTTLDVYENAFRQAVKLLLHAPNIDSKKEILEKSSDVDTTVLEKLNSKYLLDTLFNVIIDCTHLYPVNEKLRNGANVLLLKLLNINVMPLKVHVFQKFTNSFKQYIGCLMNKECVSLKCNNLDLLSANVVGVPLSQQLLLFIVHELIESEDNVIKDNCLDILTLFLKSHVLFGCYWPCLLNLLMPAVPLLMCCTFSDSLMKVLLSLHDPDSSQMTHVNQLQGNIGFLFHKDNDRRNEALTRLFYMLSNAIYANEYLPNIMEVNDTVPNDICLLETPTTCSNIFSDNSTVGDDTKRTLNNLLHMLDSPDIEPIIRKTTLMQIDILCNNWFLTAELCQAGAYFLVMRILDNALLKSSHHNYPDTAIPAVSILVKVLLYDAVLRCELAECPNIYHLLLRSLIMHIHDIQMRQDASLCLFILLFAHHLVVTDKYVEAPHALNYLQLPLQLKFCSFMKHGETNMKYEKVKSLFSSEIDESNFWRLSCARAYAGEHFECVNRNILSSQTRLNINDEFKLTLLDIKWIRCSQPNLNVQRILNSASNATNHSSLIQAVQLLKSQLFLKYFNGQDNFDHQSMDILQKLLIKYLQIPPGNEDDFKLFEEILDVAYLSIKVDLQNVIRALAMRLRKDTHNTAFLFILKKDDVPLSVFFKITKFLNVFLDKYKYIDVPTSSECALSFNGFFGDLFQLILKRARHFYDIRSLQNVRCLFYLLETLSEFQFNKPDEDLLTYCKHLMNFSMVLKTSTRTGAQWHKSCLLTILRLSNQMKERCQLFRFSGQALRFLSGLCGHHDSIIRILSWSILFRLSNTITSKSSTKLRTTSVEESSDTNSDVCTEVLENNNGCELLIKELAYLPGGFMHCCLATLFDKNEIICVRQLAGHLFANLINKTPDIKKYRKLLKQYRFFEFASETLDSAVSILSTDLPQYFEITYKGISNCELISSVVRICHIMAIHSTDFLCDLSTEPFIFGLYQVLKRPAPEPFHRAFLTLIGDICRLYTQCYFDFFEVLKNTVCRDAIWLKRYCEFMYIPYDCNIPDDINFMVDILQFLMVLSKDCTTFEFICENLSKNPLGFVKLFKQAFSTGQLGSVLQRCALSALSLLLIKSQSELEGNENRTTLLLVLESSISNSSETTSLFSYKYCKEKDAYAEQLTVAQCIVISLMEVYTHIYPIKVCKFSAPPTALQQEISQTLSLVLKVSISAQEAAHNLKLAEKVLNIFKNFFEEFSGTSCTTFVRRYGETKKNAVILNILLLLKFLIYWHSSQTMIIKDNSIGAELTKTIIQIWPWQVHSAEMKLAIIRLCAFLSERSLVICKQFSTLNSAVYANSVLQLIGKSAINETSKVKALSTDCLPIIEASLRVLMNCCSCIEGRLCLQKMHILDTFNLILTFKPRTSRVRPDLQYVWLRFWELYSRYEEGAQACHLNALCYVVNEFVPRCEIRLLALRILLNMSFQNQNRSAFITSTDLIYVIDKILTLPINKNEEISSYEEQLLMCVVLWKLMSGGIKFVAMIRGTTLAKHLRMLHENLKNTMEEKADTSQICFSHDLLNVLQIIFKLFDKS